MARTSTFRAGRPLAAALAALPPAAAARVRTTQADLSAAAECRRLVAETVAARGRLDILINMASAYVSRPFDELDEADWDRGARGGRPGRLRVRAGRGPAPARARPRRIVNVSDWVARSGRPRYPGYLPYYVAKSAVIGLTEALALSWRRTGILVNAVAPGADPPAGGHGRAGSGIGRARDAAGPLGRRRGARHGRPGARRNRLHHGRDAARGRRAPPEVSGPFFRSVAETLAGPTAEIQAERKRQPPHRWVPIPLDRGRFPL